MACTGRGAFAGDVDGSFQKETQQAAQVVAVELAFSDLNHQCEIYTAEREAPSVFPGRSRYVLQKIIVTSLCLFYFRPEL